MSHNLTTYQLNTELQYPLLSAEVGTYDGVPSQGGYLILKTDHEGRVNDKNKVDVVKNLQNAASKLSQPETNAEPLSAAQQEILKGINFSYGSYNQEKQKLAIRFDTKTDRDTPRDDIAILLSRIAHEAGFGPEKPANAQNRADEGAEKWVPLVTRENPHARTSAIARF